MEAEGRRGWWRVLALLLLAGVSNLATASRRMAITIDDLPWTSNQFGDAAEAQYTAQLLATLKRYRVPAIGFVNSNKLADPQGQPRPPRLQLLEDWLDAGLALGNHSHSHQSLNQIPRADYEADVLRGEQELKPLLARHGQTLEWFRHPFLQTGRDAATRDGFLAFLQAHAYRVAPVTIDNGEWIHALAYRKALEQQDGALQARIGADYLDYMVAKTLFFERAGRRLLARDMPHILLIHANELNARFLDPLLKRLASQGWHWVSLAEAAGDPAYQTMEDQFFGRGGISWIHRWALTAKQPQDFYADEPAVSPWILAVAGVESE